MINCNTAWLRPQHAAVIDMSRASVLGVPVGVLAGCSVDTDHCFLPASSITKECITENCAHVEASVAVWYLATKTRTSLRIAKGRCAKKDVFWLNTYLFGCVKTATPVRVFT